MAIVGQDIQDLLVSAWLQQQLDLGKKREQPIFTTKAHVFQIDPNTKKKWLPASTQAINVSYYYDSTRNSYRIISVEGSKAVINSTVTPNMTFTKTSQKFGQWLDSRANTVYGLGFASEAELSKFVEKFKEVKELTNQAQGKPPTTNGMENHTNSTETNNANTGSPVTLSKPSSLSSLPGTQQNDTGSASGERRNSGSHSSSSSEAQLKYENDRLKIALAQSSANAKKWEVELQTLKNNNARLTTALQESTSNVEEWKKQLAAYKEESARMKKRVVELELGSPVYQSGGGGAGDLTEKVRDLETANKCKQDEIKELTQKLENLKPFESQNQKLLDRIQSLERENENLRSQVSGFKQQIDGLNTSHAREKQQLRSLREQLRSRISEIQKVDDQLGSALQS